MSICDRHGLSYSTAIRLVAVTVRWMAMQTPMRMPSSLVGMEVCFTQSVVSSFSVGGFGVCMLSKRLEMRVLKHNARSVLDFKSTLTSMEDSFALVIACSETSAWMQNPSSKSNWHILQTTAVASTPLGPQKRRDGCRRL